MWGMPGLVHASALENGAYSLDSLAEEIIRRVLHSRDSGSSFDLKSYDALASPAK